MNPIDSIAKDLLDALPNPILVKDSDTRYVWVNRVFEALFSVRSAGLVGRLDLDVFPYRQVVQCNGGDLRVLETGQLDEATEVVTDPVRGERHMITRKIRVTGTDGEHFLLGVMHDITDVTVANQRLSYASATLEAQAAQLRLHAETDSLTGCLNRRALFADAPARIAANPARVTVLALDLDHFKRVNDLRGHAAGDAALKHFVTCVRPILRESDVLARIGGEEFAVLLVGVDPTTAETIAERICAKVRSTPLIFEGVPIWMTVSIGVKHASAAADETIDDVLRQADSALYRAKGDGRDRVVSAC